MAERNMSPNKTPIPEQDPQVRNKKTSMKWLLATPKKWLSARRQDVCNVKTDLA